VSTFGLDVVSRGISAVATVLLIRSLPVDSFAYVILFLNVGQFAGSALTGGIRMRYMRVEAERVSRGDSQDTGFALAWAASLALVLGVAALCGVVASIVGAGGSGTNPQTFVGLAAAFTVGHASVELAMYHHQAHLGFTRAGLIGVFRSAAILAVAIAATAGFLKSGTAVATWIAAAVLAVAAVACLPLARKTLRARAISTVRGDFGHESGWLTLYYLTSAGFSYASIFVVAALLDDAAVASYGAALRYCAIVLGPAPALLAVLRVRTSQHDIVDSSKRQVDMLMSWVKRSAIPLTVMLGIAVAAAPVVIPAIDGGRYPDSVPIFQLMMIPALVNYATMPGPNLLMSQRRYKLLAGVYAIALPIQVCAAGLGAEIAGVVAVAGAVATVEAIEASTVAFLAIRVRLRPAKQPT
jgi:O-antigen/teichoic acid export membrane protein